MGNQQRFFAEGLNMLRDDIEALAWQVRVFAGQVADSREGITTADAAAVGQAAADAFTEIMVRISDALESPGRPLPANFRVNRWPDDQPECRVIVPSINYKRRGRIVCAVGGAGGVQVQFSDGKERWFDRDELELI